MAGAYSQVGGAAGTAAGTAIAGPVGGLVLGYAGKKLGEYLDKTPEEKQLEAMQKAQFAKLKRGDDLGLSRAEKSSMTMGTQQNAAALQQQMAAQNERLAASGTVSPAAIFQAQQMQGKQALDAVAQSRMQAEQLSQTIAEKRKKSIEAMLSQRAMEEQQKRGIRGKEGEMTADTRDYGTETTTALQGASGGNIGMLSTFL